MEWRDSLRANLALWPTVTPNLLAVASCAGQPLNEDDFLKAIQTGGTPISDEASAGLDEDGVGEGKAATTARTVRQTVEVLVLGGIAYRDQDKRFQLTPVGTELIAFLTATAGSSKLSNPKNFHLAGRLLLPGLMAVPEYRAVLILASLCGGQISTEEFNRSIPLLEKLPYPGLPDLGEIARKIIASRSASDVTQVGPRWYRNEDYGTSGESDQRKAINPWFLLSGGGGLVLESYGVAGRRLNPILAPEVKRMASLEAPLIDLPRKNVIEASQEFGRAFSDRCLS